MKFSYSLVKKLAPGLPSKAKAAEGLNLYSFETENLDGDLLEISLSSNRYSDAASHIGIAREAAAIFGLKLKNPVKEIVNPPSDLGFLNVEVKDKSSCPRYAARYFENVKIGESPLWLQKILKTCGLKPINNVVDLMNYVMLEVGQPLHAFDFDKVKSIKIKNQKSKIKINESKAIFIRRAKNGEKIETLDGQKFTLDSSDLVIADSEKSMGIAGIKGGANSGIGGNTRRIVVEAANFDGAGIFKTSRRLKLNTDASLRFSHNISPVLVDRGLDRATEMLLESGAKLVDSVDYYPKPVGEELVGFDVLKYEKLIGAPVSAGDAERRFNALGFSVERGRVAGKKSGFLVRVPAWRNDIENFEDLAEEISRLSDYGKLRPQAPAVGLKPAEEENIIILKDRIRETLSHFRLDEVYNYSFVEPADARRSGANAAELVELQNPVSKDFPCLLPSLECGLLKNISFNSRFFDEIRIFEIGKVFRKKGGAVDPRAKRGFAPAAFPVDNPRSDVGVEEKLHLGIALSAKKESLILELKGIADELLKGLGVADVSFVESGGSLRVESDHRVIAALKFVYLEKGRTVSVAEFDLEKLLPLIEEEREFKPLPRYPAVVRDISLLVPADTRIGDVLAAIQDANPNLAEDIDLIDEYTPPPARTYAEETQNDADNLPRSSASSQRASAVRRSLTFRIIFQAEDRTLTDAEVNREMEKISAKLKKDFRAEIR